MDHQGGSGALNTGYAAPMSGHEAQPAAVPERNLALELVRATEAAAMAAARWVGRGDKNGADGAAVNAMRTMVSGVRMNGIVVIGEGEKMKRRCCLMVNGSVTEVVQQRMLP